MYVYVYLYIFSSILTLKNEGEDGAVYSFGTPLYN